VAKYEDNTPRNKKVMIQVQVFGRQRQRQRQRRRQRQRQRRPDYNNTSTFFFKKKKVELKTVKYVWDVRILRGKFMLIKFKLTGIIRTMCIKLLKAMGVSNIFIPFATTPLSSSSNDTCLDSPHWKTIPVL
jgi:hypothetical protein